MDTAAIAERVRHYLKANQIQWTRFGDLADNQGEKALQTTAQGAFGQQDIAEGSFLTQVTLPVASGFPETASASDDNGNMICLSSDSVDVEIFPNILSYQEQAAADHLEEIVLGASENLEEVILQVISIKIMVNGCISSSVKNCHQEQNVSLMVAEVDPHNPNTYTLALI